MILNRFIRFLHSTFHSFIAVKDYPAAMENFMQCVTTPANSLSYIVVCALKKAKLIALIYFGRELVVST